MSIMEADEYMNPKMSNSVPGPSRLGSSSTAGADIMGSMNGRHNWDRELRKFGDIHRLGKTLPVVVVACAVREDRACVNVTDAVVYRL